MTRSIPVIDLFAGPGGLGEGFSSISGDNGKPAFSIKLSIEKDPVAHKTLSLRAFFRQFEQGKAPDCYYDYISGKINRDDFINHADVKDAWQLAQAEAQCAELGKVPSADIDALIERGLNGASDWLLIGGPPCQAYSMVGRSRRTKEDRAKFESDEKHFLYKEYLRIIQKFKPAVFVMENVKGMLSSQHNGGFIFEKIIADLTRPAEGLDYEVRSLVVNKEQGGIVPSDYVIRAEDHGIPQARHRVILFGIRRDVAETLNRVGESGANLVIKKESRKISVAEVIDDLPELRSKLSRGIDEHWKWLETIKGCLRFVETWARDHQHSDLVAAGKVALGRAEKMSSLGSTFIPNISNNKRCSLFDWYHDPKLKGVIQHEARGHMPSDIQRYFFAALHAECGLGSPRLKDFPAALLPTHKNAVVPNEKTPFSDRFKVQLEDKPSTTVVSHIAKDGHYFIHYDPAQCRSLTVREAARLQTFPDNYFFEGNRTEQYHQVGNAVPPLLARKIAEIVLKVFDRNGQ